VLIPVSDLVKYWGVNPKQVLHVGAHNAEELNEYTKFGWNNVTWVEAQPEKISILKKKVPQHQEIIEAAVWDKSTSLLNLGTHVKEHPSVKLHEKIPVKTKTLAEVVPENLTPDLIALDIQGVELRALQGFGDRLREVKWIYCEVNKQYLYEECCLVDEIDSYLISFGFKRVATRWTYHGWGDALYVQTKLLNHTKKTVKFGVKVSEYRWFFKDYRMRAKETLIRFRDSYKSIS
jgi:FkbM family methyltransferase